MLASIKNVCSISINKVIKRDNNNMKKLLLSLGVSMAAVSAHAVNTPVSDLPAGDYILDKTHTSISFKVKHMGLSNYTARFNDFDATLTLDPSDITKSALMASVNPLSIETDFQHHSDEKDFNKKLGENADWFNGLKFPEVTFKATNLVKTSDNTGTMTGDFTMLGMTKPVAFDVTFNGAYASKPFANVPAMGFSAVANIKRSEWGFDTYVPNIGDDVQIIIETEFHKK